MQSKVKGIVAVVGGGRMGAGIAQVFSTIGYDVHVVESSDETATGALERIRSGLQRALEHGKEESDLEPVTERIRFITNIADLPMTLTSSSKQFRKT